MRVAVRRAYRSTVDDFLQHGPGGGIAWRACGRAARATHDSPEVSGDPTKFALVLCIAIPGCVAADEPEVDHPTDTDVTTPVGDDLGSFDASEVFQGATPFLSCHPGEVGDTRWMGSACCGTSRTTKRQYLYRCDGRNWQKTVNTRCVAGTCAI